MKADWWNEEHGSERQAFGMVLHKKSDDWVVHRTLLGSPAEVSGVQSGDVIQSVGGNVVAKSLRSFSVIATIELLDVSNDHKVSFVRNGSPTVVSMRPKMLRDLLQAEVDRGGTALTYCYSCPGCYNSTSGVSNCPSDCPSTTCIIG